MRVQFGFLVPPPSLVTSPSGSAPSGGLRLGAEDFAAPAQVGSSYLFERLLGWGVALGVRLRAGGVRLELGAPPPDDEGRHLFFVRARPRTVAGPSRPATGSRTEIHKARPAGVAYLSFRLGEDAVEVAFIVPAKAKAERAHLERLLLEKPRLVADALDALPLNFVVGPAGKGARAPVQEIDRAHLEELLRSGDSVWIGWTVPRATALTHAATIGGELEAAMLALGELFRQLAWLQRAAPPGAAVPKAKHREGRGSARISAAAADDAAPDVRSAPLTADDRLALLRGARAAARPDARASLRLRSSAGGRPARASSSSAGSTNGSTGSYPGGRPRSRPPSASGAAPHPDAVPGVDRGAEVEVLAGPFTGRVGVVQEIDGKGDARVLFGLLATRIAAKDLALSIRDAAGKARPSLGSSHRKGR
jgi:hypothetical protein